MPDSEALRIAAIEKRAAVRLKSSTPALSATPAASLVPAALSGRVRMLVLGPDECLAVADSLEGPALRESLRRHLGQGSAAQLIAAVDLSSGLKAVRVEGRAARELLGKGCGLDFHPRSFPTGHCTRTRFAQLAVVIDCPDERTGFDLYVGRSYLRDLSAWLIDAALEFQQPGGFPSYGVVGLGAAAPGV
jgi:sarcosine oxidase, subunit gamma